MGFFGIRSVAEYERLAVFQMSGRFAGLRGPGIVFITPGQTVHSTIDLREQIQDIPDQHCLTKDSVVVIVDPIVFYQIRDPEKAILTVNDPLNAIISVARTTLRAVVGDLELLDVTGNREGIASSLRARLSEESDRWGIDITNVEIADLKLQPEVEQAMAHRRASVEQAEANRSITVLDAEAQREGAKAESEALITRSEAEKTAMIAQAEGEKQAQVLRAEGLDYYFRKLTALGSDADTAIRFEQVAALKEFAASPNAKLVIIPSEMKELTGQGLGSMRDLAFTEGAIPGSVKSETSA